MLIAAGGVAAHKVQRDDARPALAVMGTIPLYWGEAADLDELIGGEYEPHWARAVIERDWQLVPLDYLGADALADTEHLLLAQPRGLTPEENVALDAWVRAGGRLLLFADPMMTGETRFGLGDRRRPQDVALLSPILAHWGLTLEFDADQPPGIAMREFAGGKLPVNLAGRFALGEGGEARCALGAEALVASCTLGEGRIVALADAALLDHAGPWSFAPDALAILLERAFGESGDFAGRPAEANPAHR